MSSQKSSVARDAARRPQRERGRARVAALLKAAGEAFTDKGFDAATMTEIAARAGASIGSLYQFFPTKDLLADALHTQMADDLSAMLDTLAVRCEAKSGAVIADALFRDLSAFLTAHPAFTVLADWRGLDPRRKKQNRRRLRAQLARILERADPPLPSRRADALGVVVLHLLRTAVAIAGEPDLPDRADVLDELRAMLRAHLTGR
jgi:AcrR family transcriptional regulator